MSVVSFIPKTYHCWKIPLSDDDKFLVQCNALELMGTAPLRLSHTASSDPERADFTLGKSILIDRRQSDRSACLLVGGGYAFQSESIESQKRRCIARKG